MGFALSYGTPHKRRPTARITGSPNDMCPFYRCVKLDMYIMLTKNMIRRFGRVRKKGWLMAGSTLWSDNTLLQVL